MKAAPITIPATLATTGTINIREHHRYNEGSRHNGRYHGAYNTYNYSSGTYTGRHASYIFKGNSSVSGYSSYTEHRTLATFTATMMDPSSNDRNSSYELH